MLATGHHPSRLPVPRGSPPDPVAGTATAVRTLASTAVALVQGPFSLLTRASSAEREPSWS